MPKIKIAVLVSSDRRESINRKLAQAIAKLAGEVLGILGVLAMGGEAYISFKPGLVDANGAVMRIHGNFCKVLSKRFAALLARLFFARAAAA